MWYNTNSQNSLQRLGLQFLNLLCLTRWTNKHDIFTLICIHKRLKVINFTFTIRLRFSCLFCWREPPPCYLKACRIMWVFGKLTCRYSVWGWESQVHSNWWARLRNLGGDWKFLALVTGIDSATIKSIRLYVWCKCPMDECRNIDKKR